MAHKGVGIFENDFQLFQSSRSSAWSWRRFKAQASPNRQPLNCNDHNIFGLQEHVSSSKLKLQSDIQSLPRSRLKQGPVDTPRAEKKKRHRELTLARLRRRNFQPLPPSAIVRNGKGGLDNSMQTLESVPRRSARMSTTAAKQSFMILEFTKAWPALLTEEGSSNATYRVCFS